MRIGRLIVASAVTTLSSLLIATSAHAVAATLHNGQGSTAASFQQECTGPFNPLPAGTDGWHFVLPGQGEFQSITITFSGGVVAGPITSTITQSGPGWSGFLDSAGQGGGIKHAYIFTSPTGLTLINGIATTTAGDSFNLSHTCSGAPRPSSSVVPSGGAETGGGGSYSMPIAGIGALAVAGGLAAFLYLHRRRDETA